MKKKRLFVFLYTLCVFTACLGVAACKQQAETLAAPSNLQVEQRVLTWDKVENASGYVVFVNGQEFTVTEPRLELFPIGKEGDFHMRVMAVGDGQAYEDSVWVTDTFTLEAPIEHGYDEAGFEYVFLEEELGYEVAKGKADLKGFLSIPDYFDGYPVVRIAEWGFSPDIRGDKIAADAITGVQCNDVTTGIKLPSFLRSIGQKGCDHMRNVTEVDIPSTVTELGKCAFSGWMNLKRVVIPEGVKVIPESCFNDTGLEEVVFPKGLERIELCAFQCLTQPWGLKHISSQLSDIVIPDSVTLIGSCAFRGRENLKNITMSKNIKDVGILAFDDTPWLNSQNGLVYINDTILYQYVGDMPEHTEIVIPSKTTYINAEAFRAQKNLEKVFIPDGVQLGVGCFSVCTSLKEVRLPSDLTVIPDGAFANTNIESITIPKNVKIIGSAFASCKNLREVVLNEELECIERSAFRGCKALSSVRFPASLKAISGQAFTGCTALTEAIFENEDGWADYSAESENGKYVAVLQNGTVTPVEDITLLTDNDVLNYFWICGNPDGASEYLEYLRT